MRLMPFRAAFIPPQSCDLAHREETCPHNQELFLLNP